MADFQFQPDPEARLPKLIDGLLQADRESLIAQLLRVRGSCLTIDARSAQTVLNFKFAPLDEQYIEPVDPASHGEGAEADPVVIDIEGGELSLQGLQWDNDLKFRSRTGSLPPPVFSLQSLPPQFT